MKTHEQKTILLVEDEVIIALAQAQKIDQFGFTVIIANSGDEAVHLAANNNAISLVLMDIDLGKGIDGTEAAKRILAERIIPIVFLTSHSEREMVEKVRGITRYGYVNKNSGDFVLQSSIEMAFELFESNLKTIAKEEKYRFLIENLNDVIFTLDMEGVITYASPMVERLTFYHVEEVIGRKIIDFIHPDDRLLFSQSHTRTLEGKQEHCEFRIINKDSTVKFVRTSSNLIKKNGRIIGEAVLMSDITDRRRAEDDLHQTLLFLHETEKIAKVGGWKTNIETNSLLWTDGIKHIIESPPDYQPGLAEGLKFYAPEYIPLIQEAVKRALEDGTPFVMGTEVITATGKHRWTELRGLQRIDGVNEPAVIGTLQDITERKLADEAMRIQYELSLALNSTTDLRQGIDIVLNFLLRFESIDCGGVYVADPASGALDLLVHRGLSPEFVAHVSHFAADSPSVRMVLTGNARFGNYADISPAVDEIRLKEGLRASALLPVMSQGQLIALINLASHSHDTIPAETRISLETLSLQIGSTVMRLRTDAFLKESEERYRALFDRSLDCVYIHDFEGRFIDANDAALNMLGYKREEIHGLNFASLLSEDQLPIAFKALQEIRDTGFQKDLTELRLRSRNGSDVYVETIGSAIFSKGTYTAIQSIARNITERKRAEEALRASESQYRLLSEHTTDTVWLMDLNFKIIYQSPSVEKLRGFSSQEIMEMPLDRHVTPESFKLVSEVILKEMPRVRADPGYNPVRTLELEYYCKDGTTVWMENNFSVIRDESSRLVSILGEARDITMRKRVEEKLMESEFKYRSLIEHSSDVVFCVDRNGEYKFVNQVFASTFGKPTDYFLGKTFWDIYPKEHADHRQAASTRVFETGESQSVEVTVPLPDRTLYFIAKANPVRDETGKVVLNLTHATDITDRKLAEAALESSLEEKSALLRELQHRVKNSLAMITSLIDLESEMSMSNETHSILGNLRGRVSSLSSLYTLLYQSGGVERIRLDEYIKRIVHSISQTFTKGLPGIRIEQDLSPVEISVKSAAPLGLIVNELLINALKYAFPAGRSGIVRVVLQNSTDTIDLTVSDDGIGTPRKFDPAKSEGFGLHLVDLLAKQLGGTVTHERGDTTMFKVRIPVEV